LFDAAAIFGGPRSKRYALVIEDGKVKEAHVEPDNTGVDGTSYALCPPRIFKAYENSFRCREGLGLIWVVDLRYALDYMKSIRSSSESFFLKPCLSLPSPYF
jgi:hypothetical protein